MLSFAPDAIDIAPELLQSVSAVPTVRGYKNPPAGLDMGKAQLAATPQGAAYLLKLDDTYRTVVGTTSKLYEVSGSSWSDVSRGTSYSVGTNRWRFGQFGNTSIAANKGVQLQYSSSGAFADIANSPKSAHIEVVSGFVLCANIDDSSTGLTTGYGDQPHRWWCSQFQNPTGTWEPSASTLATTGLLVETPGPITGLRRLANDVAAYKGRSIYVGRYIPGSADVWRWQCMSKDIGTVAGDSIVAVGQRHFFVGDADFYQFDGAVATPIGELVKTWFFNRLNRAFASLIQALHDRSAKVIYWFYPADESSTLNACIAYHYDTGRWGSFDIDVLDVLETVTGAITYADVGTLFSTYGDITGSLSYGSPFWSANTPVLAYFSSTKYLTSLSGTATSLTLRTGWFGDEAIVQLCSRVKPRWRTAPSSATLDSQVVMSLGNTPQTVETALAMSSGRFDVLQSSRYHRFDITASGSCEIEAVIPTMQQDGLE